VLGLRAYPIDAKSHDRIAALVSHLPYLVSAALLLTAQAQGDDLPGWPGMVGPGFLDTSRVGSSNPALWDDILRANREAVRPVLERFSSVIEQWVEDLRQERPCTGLADAPNIRHAVKEEQPCS
jgi:prephenate dehydrogenase